MIRFGHLESRVEAVHELSRSLSVATGLQVGVNAYVSNPRQQGLPIHFDAEDTFIIQLEGSKQWQLYSSLVTLPDQDQQWPLNSDDVEQLGAPSESITCVVQLYRTEAPTCIFID
jgi:ribosomal protein L16 Arg81 hydroxylase